MMTLQNSSMFSIPLAWDAHDQAQLNRQRSATGQAKQVYLRTLAVYAVKYYLDCMSIQAQFDDMVNTATWCNLSQTATITLPGLGNVECLPVVLDATTVFIPPEAWGDPCGNGEAARVAYIAVQLDSDLRSATILGYVETAKTEEIPITQFQQKTAEDLLVYLDQLQQTHTPSQKIQQLQIQLSQWFENKFDHGWHLAYRQGSTATRKSKSINGFKVFDLKQSDEQVELSVSLSPLDTNELDIWVEVYPTDEQQRLPANLKLLVLDDLDDVVMQAQANETKNIQFQFSGKPGEQFSVQLMLGNTVVTQPFVI